MAQYTYHSADSRGDANHGWLHSRHTFSFASYHNPERIHFGALRVLNDDYVAGGKGFGMHPHQNMEIISIPLEGDLKHSDSMGNSGVIRNGDIQVMSAGTGVYHSEYNNNPNKPVKFLQIWVIPNEMNLEPRYEQVTLDPKDRKNVFQQVISPNPDDEGLWIHQNAWFNMAEWDAGFEKEYIFHSSDNGLYIFVLKGNIIVDSQRLSERDGLGIWETGSVQIKADSPAEFLLMEVPMAV
jgi:redox-sensitive bicupin YhaK (pirin superfamily)